MYKNFLKIQKELEKASVELEFLPDTQSFFLSHEDFLKQYQKPPILEYFYRFMRKREHIMLDENNEPLGGKWNYDEENRKFDKSHSSSWNFSLEKNSFVLEAEEYYNGALFPNLIPTNRPEALKLLEYFCEHHLADFGRLEDAMYETDNYVHHSLLSTAINF